MGNSTPVCAAGWAVGPEGSWEDPSPVPAPWGAGASPGLSSRPGSALTKAVGFVEMQRLGCAGQIACSAILLTLEYTDGQKTKKMKLSN